MKKLFLFLIATLVDCICAYAQSSLIGTLSHNGEVSVYYGADALIKAHDAAVPGDVITLSAGTFTAATITKAVTIRGAGMMLEQMPTILSGTLKLNLNQNENDIYSLNLEGLRILNVRSDGTMKSPSFLKCYFNTGDISTLNYDKAIFINCYVNDVSKIYGYTYPFASTSFINCIIASYANNNSNHTVAMNNCIILKLSSISYPYGYTTADTYNTTWTNCIIMQKSYNSDSFAFESGVFINCKYQGYGSDPFSRVGSSCTNTKKVADDLVLFKPDTFYDLSENLVDNNDWLGNDGTQIGIYGGLMPFDPTPTNPQITKFKVANKTSADGKLSVDIEVSAAQ